MTALTIVALVITVLAMSVALYLAQQRTTFATRTKVLFVLALVSSVVALVLNVITASTS